MAIIEHIKQQYSFLSPQEQKVALAVIQKGASIQRIGIDELAAELQVSNSTISRFVRKIGCQNFVDFKLQFSEGPQPTMTGFKDRLIMNRKRPLKFINSTKMSSLRHRHGLNKRTLISWLVGSKPASSFLSMVWVVQAIRPRSLGSD